MELQTRSMSSLLAALAPDRLAALRKLHPAQTTLFETAYELGETTVPAGGDRHAALLALVQETSRVPEPMAHEMVGVLSARLRRARVTRLAGAVAAAVSGAGAGGTVVAAVFPKLQALAISLTALAGAVLVLVGEHLEKPLVGGARSVSEFLADGLAAEAAFADIRIKLLTQDLSNLEQLGALAREANAAAAKVRQIAVFGGVPGSRDPVPPGSSQLPV